MTRELRFAQSDITNKCKLLLPSITVGFLLIMILYILFWYSLNFLPIHS